MSRARPAASPRTHPYRQVDLVHATPGEPDAAMSFADRVYFLLCLTLFGSAFFGLALYEAVR